MLGAILATALAASGCTKDTDCKGDRICEDGKCVSPPAATAAPDAGLSSAPAFTPPPPPPPALDPAEYPKVVRKNGLTCVQSLGEDGVVREDCRNEAAEYSGTRRAVDLNDSSPPPSSSFPPPRVAEPEPQRSSVTADFAAFGSLGIVVAGSAGITGGFGVHLSVAGRVSDGVALGGLLDGQFWFPSGGFLLLATLAPALRLGDVGHATVGLGPSILYLSSYLVSGAVLMGTLVLHGGVPLAGAFGVHPRLSFSFGSGAVILALGFGFGGSVF